MYETILVDPGGNDVGGWYNLDSYDAAIDTCAGLSERAIMLAREDVEPTDEYAIHLVWHDPGCNADCRDEMGMGLHCSVLDEFEAVP